MRKFCKILQHNNSPFFFVNRELLQKIYFMFVKKPLCQAKCCTEVTIKNLFAECYEYAPHTICVFHQFCYFIDIHCCSQIVCNRLKSDITTKQMSIVTAVIYLKYLVPLFFIFRNTSSHNCVFLYRHMSYST